MPDAANGNLVASFTQARPRLRALAHRLLGSLSDADDVVQDAWLRWSAVDPASIAVPEAFLTTLVSRLALDRLRSAQRIRAAYRGQWLPEPVVLSEAELELPGELSVGFLLLLERLTPDQRAVYVLREAMDLDYAEIAAILEKSQQACRQSMRRARDGLAGPARFPVDGAVSRSVADAFARASLARDYRAIVALLDVDAVLLADGGGMARSAINPIYGADRIARFFIGIQNKMKGPLSFQPAMVNKTPALITRVDGQLHGALLFDLTDGVIRQAFLIVNPLKLRHLGVV